MAMLTKKLQAKLLIASTGIKVYQMLNTNIGWITEWNVVQHFYKIDFKETNTFLAVGTLLALPKKV